MLWFQLILKNTNDRILHKKFDLLCLTVGWTLLFRFISFKGHILATKLLEGDKGKSAKEYLKAMFWCLYLWKVHTSKLILLMYTWCYDGLTVYPRVIQIWKPFWFKEANIFDNKNNKNFHSYNASDIDGVLTIQWIVSTWLSWLCGCIDVYSGALDQMILALGIIQMSNIAQFEERKLLENN